MYASQKIRNVRIEHALRQIGLKIESGDWYYYNRTDLNGDDKPEALVFLMAKDACGSGGCDLVVMKQLRNRYKVVATIGLSLPPVVVSSKRTNGWNDLIVWQRSYLKEGESGYFSVLRFDGRSYPANPTVEPAVPLEEAVEGVAYMVDPKPEEGVQIR